MAEISRRNSRNFASRNERRGQTGASQGGRGQQSGSSGGGDRPRIGASGCAAVPWYLGQDFDNAPPGHRYFSYLKFWQNDWSAIKEGKQRVLKEIGFVPEHATTLMRELAARQRDIGISIGAEILSATSISPFATGLGWEHPNENGFAFLQPYGLPYLAGSGVKGVVREAARQLTVESDAQNHGHGWDHQAIAALFGPTPEHDNAIRGALRFFDVIPELAGNRLDVDIMNPHYGRYYQGDASPHDAGTPVPIFFLILPPGSRFTFVVDCPREGSLPAELATRWREHLHTAFNHAFDWLGFGAKTAVGYGAMSLAPASTSKPETSALAAEAESKVTAKAPARPQTAGSAPRDEKWAEVTITWNPGPREVIGTAGQNRALARGRDADNFLQTLNEQQRRQLERKKQLTNVRVLVEIVGNQKMLKRLD